MAARSQSPEFLRAQAEQEEFASRPEVKALLEQQMKAHLEAWYTERVPALKNKTPLEAARTKAGRERLDALLVDFERRNSELQESESHLRIDVQAMRKRLCL